MQVEEKPDVTYSDVGGCKEQIEKLREVVETPLLHVSNSLEQAAVFAKAGFFIQQLVASFPILRSQNESIQVKIALRNLFLPYLLVCLLGFDGI